jgi:tetratricopeptide (TPR) repeat protein
MNIRSSVPQRSLVLLSAAASAVVVGVIWIAFPRLVGNLTEDIAFAMDPSAAHALAQGERHFDGKQPDLYDLDRAQFFLQEAAVRDPNLPYVFHQLARIAFLRGDFNTALIEINLQIAKHGDALPNSYYVRGLIEGYMGDYAAAATDYEHYLSFDPNNWAAMNDYAWVLIKDRRFEDAYTITEKGLALFPDNVWLLNSRSIALYELGDIEAAYASAQRAVEQADTVTPSLWLSSYPGNDPAQANEGVATVRRVAINNRDMIAAALASGKIQ